MKKYLFIILLIAFMTLAEIIATLGQVTGANEGGVSEFFSGSREQTKPLLMGSLTGREGAYVRSPVAGGTSVDSISGGQYTSGPRTGTSAVGNASNTSGYNINTPVQNTQGATSSMTNDEAIKRGLDVNQLRREGRLIEGSGGGDADAAAKAYAARVQSAKDSLNAIKTFIASQIDQARGIRDEYSGKINNTYTGLKNTAKDKLTEILSALADEDRGVVKTYEQTQGGINRASEGALAGNRALARALGIGNSSYYMNTQDKTRTNLLDKTAGLTTERADKLSGIAERGTEAKTWEGRKQVELDQEKAGLEAENERNYQAQVAKAQLDERLFGIDSAEQIEQAGIAYQQTANDIARYVASRNPEFGGMIAGASGAQSGAIGSETAVTPKLSSILADTSAIQESTVPFSGIQGSAGYTGPAISRALLDLKKKPEDQYLYA